MLLGAIADDVTGATDLASVLTRQGLRVVQALGVPLTRDRVDADAAVVALKTRNAPPDDAVRQALAAARWLEAQGVQQVFFKYCSTFDSTDTGNIGNVADALLDHLGEPFTIACPAYPVNGRTVYQGHLFVGTRLLSESGMRDHPLTPMRDPDLCRVLARQCRGGVGLVPLAVVASGAEATAREFAALREGGVRIAVVDALTDDHLETIGRASTALRLVTGGAGVAAGLPGNFRRAGALGPASGPAALPDAAGPVLVLAGSCSAATQEQVAAWLPRFPAVRVDPIAVAEGRQTVPGVCAAVKDGLARGAALVYATAGADEVTAAQARLGVVEAAQLVESTLAAVARTMVDAGVRTLVVAGGETSGQVAAALGLETLRIGPEIAPGVPWTLHEGDPDLVVAFKSGNFGGPGFFLDAVRLSRPS